MNTNIDTLKTLNTNEMALFIDLIDKCNCCAYKYDDLDCHIWGCVSGIDLWLNKQSDDTFFDGLRERAKRLVDYRG